MSPSEGVEYPPLTPLSEYPLHGWDYGRQYACQGGVSTYDWRCAECVDIAWNEVVQGRDVHTWWRQSVDHDEREVTLGWLVARARAHGVKTDRGPSGGTA
jgi:hypothetical protein